MIGAGIELRIDCTSCSQAIHVNAFVPRIDCDACAQVHELPLERWRDLLEDVWDEIPDYANGRGGRSQVFQGQYAASNLLYARFNPYCFDCKTDFDMNAVGQAASGGARKIHCHGCGKPWHVRLPAQPIKAMFPHLWLLVAEDETLLGHTPGAPPEGVKPIVFQCPSCNAPLKVDGTNRVPQCGYCNADVYLPDGLWRRLHPVSKLQRWFLWWDEGGRVRDPSRFPDDD